MASAARLRFVLPPSASAEQLCEGFRNIARMCSEKGLTRAVMILEGRLKATREDLIAALEMLSPTCRPGFVLAFVAADPESFDDFVAIENTALQAGIRARAFFNEAGAAQWLA
jgi:hypothetical protein